MKPTMIRLTPADYVTTQWSGGTTTQLAIAPEGAVYAARDFLWRVSSAAVELAESDFTALADYYRYIAPLRGEMTLRHNGGAERRLVPYEVHGFDGGDDTRSRGRCTDFNLMLRKDRCDGALRAIRCGDAPSRIAVRADWAVVYCAQGSCALRCGTAEQALAAGECALLCGEIVSLELTGADDAVCMLATIRERREGGADV